MKIIFKKICGWAFLFRKACSNGEPGTLTNSAFKVSQLS